MLIHDSLSREAHDPNDFGQYKLMRTFHPIPAMDWVV